MTTKNLPRTAGAVLATAIALAVAGAAAPAIAQQTFNITVISGNAPQLSAVKAVTDGFIPTVNEALAKGGKYKINWNEAYSGQIAKPRGELEAIQTGLGDIGVIITAYTPDKMPLHQIAFSTPFASTEIGDLIDGINLMNEKFADFRKEWDAFGQVMLRASAVVDNYVLFTKKPVKSFEDLKGMKLMGVGANLPWLRAAGAAAITGEIATVYNSLQTGIYEGTLLWQQITAALKLCEPARYALDIGIGGSPTVALSINKRTWEKLPDEVKQAFRDGAKRWHEVNMKVLLDGTKTGEDACVKQFNQVKHRLDDADRKKWAEAMQPLGQEWAKQASAKGAPGKEMMTVWMDFLRSKGQPILRHWDRD
jgi:TRAP-type C4-dicarboxylate transport system substrate-binding protein